MVALLYTFLFFIFQENDSKFIIKNSIIKFFSYAPLENINAENKNSVGVIDFESKEFIIKIPMNKFDFPNNLMEKHYNDSYLETEKFPSCIFKGSISEEIDLLNNKNQQVNAIGKLELHGVSKDFKIPLNVKKNDNSIIVTSEFEIRLDEFKIKIPKLLFKNIAEVIEVNVNAELKKYIKE
tara:strand:- start:39 stop:581 length:543 start_codon:yes stop_codon:yes gene_type:complete